MHYLISFPVPGGYMHGYVMVLPRDERFLSRITEGLMNEAEKRGLKCWPPIVLTTRLDDGWQLVREIISRHYSEPARRWEKVKDFHLTGWVMPAADPDTERLMELH